MITQLLAHNDIVDAGMSAIGFALLTNDTLSTLNLRIGRVADVSY